eukprot:2261511-Lingulodinium_polyedra.AAC.1
MPRREGPETAAPNDATLMANGRTPDDDVMPGLAPATPMRYDAAVGGAPLLCRTLRTSRQEPPHAHC